MSELIQLISILGGMTFCFMLWYVTYQFYFRTLSVFNTYCEKQKKYCLFESALVDRAAAKQNINLKKEAASVELMDLFEKRKKFKHKLQEQIEKEMFKNYE